MSAKDPVLRNLGYALRRVREQSGLSLHQVEVKSGGEWKAVVVGSYERGDRGINVARLIALARFYGVPPRSLLPAAEPEQELAAAIDAAVGVMQAHARGLRDAAELAGEVTT